MKSNEADVILKRAGVVVEPTTMREISPGLLMKFELENPGGSHKWRAARHIVDCAVQRGDVVLGETTIIEKTGGNFGLGLVLACASYGLPIDLVVGPGFSAKKRGMLESYGATCVGDDMLKDGVSPPEVVDFLIDHQVENGKQYFFTNQHQNNDGTVAHELETGAEIVSQLSKIEGLEKVTFVSCAGTGAHMTGISKALDKAGLLDRAILVDPDGCNSREGVFIEHPLEGISVMVPPLLDWTLVADRRTVTEQEMREVQLQFAKDAGFLIGNTSAACLKVSQDICREYAQDPTHKVLTIAYDHALWYLP